MEFFPIDGNGAFYKFGEPCNVSRILTPGNTHNFTVYGEYSSLYLPIRFAFVYFLAFALLTWVSAHVALHRESLIHNALLGRESEGNDIHQKLVRAYQEVSGWVYAAFGTAYT